MNFTKSIATRIIGLALIASAGQVLAADIYSDPNTHPGADVLRLVRKGVSEPLASIYSDPNTHPGADVLRLDRKGVSEPLASIYSDPNTHPGK